MRQREKTSHEKKRKHDRHAHSELLIEGNIYVGINVHAHTALGLSITSHYIKQLNKKEAHKKGRIGR